MQEASQISEFGKVFIYLVMGVLFVLFTFFIGRLVALKKPSAEKLTSYECGEEPKGDSWIQFNSRFYVVALIFLLFDVEMVFIFPWATVFGQEQLLAADPRWGWLTLAEMFAFIGILILGLVYAWKKGDLEWVKPVPVKPSVSTGIPQTVYQRINEEKYRVKSFDTGLPSAVPLTPQAVNNPSSPARPMFKPTFKKPGA